PPQVQLREQMIAAFEYVVGDRPLAILLLSAGHTPDAEAAGRLEQFFGEVRDLIERALEIGIQIGLVRKCRTNIVAAAMLGMIRGGIERMVHQTDAPTVDEVVDELLLVALRGLLA
ncbi:MAG: hypothetical protein NT062_26080, partial [Proteobacteria bacterium]|nr:hypothetical protein [Pseudomonadota bacterium]